jgi:hypothetical protein
MRPRAVALARSTAFHLTLWALALPGGSARAAETQQALRLEVGAEHDTNPARLEAVEGLPAPAIEAAAALRLAADLDAQVITEGHHLFALRLSAAAKRFLESHAEPEDLLLLDGRAGADLALGSRNVVGLSLSHYDAFQRAPDLPEARDFRSSAPSLRWDHRLGAARFSLGGGWRWFSFKPERAFDFQAPTAFAVYRHLLTPSLEEGGAEWDWGASLQFEHRAFRGVSCTSLVTCTPQAEAPRRRDDFFSLALDATRTGGTLLGAGVALMSNRSNSYGESLERLALHLRAALVLPLGLSLAARAEGVLTRYRDSVPVGHDAMTMSFVSVEDEGRSTLRLELARPFATRYDVGLRYILYTSLPRTSEVRFERHTALFFLAVQLGG